MALHSECPYAAQAGPDELVRFGHALQNEGRLDAAAGCYARITRLHPAFADGWFEHGLALQSLGDLAAAVRTFASGLRLRPSDAGRLNAHGVMLQTAGRHTEARRAYSRSLARAPSNAEAYFNLGTLHEALGAPSDALAAYRSALELHSPDESRIHNNIGGVLAAQGELASSVTAYGEAVEADPGFADGWYNLGNVLLGMGRFIEAEAPLRRALRVTPQHDKAARKLRQLGAEQLKLRQAELEAEQQVIALERAIDTCADDSACLQALTAETDARRDADGPLIV
mmetsp:Transcript_24261/g.49255  ORF Transcript_24261/g.49255 Transcript_24261/m.49255 type:complete len:284 (-) Transcript_24261:88-939(-)